MIICHGIPSGVVSLDDPGYSALAVQISRMGFLAVHFNFRGCGQSGGNFDILGWTEVDQSRLVLLGFSAGAAVSIYVAAREQRVTAIIAGGCLAEFAALADANNLEASLKYFSSIGIIRDEGYTPHPER